MRCCVQLYEGSTVYHDLATLINEHDMNIKEVKIREYYVQHSIKDGIFSELVFAEPVYIITGKRGNTIIYTNIPKGVKLPREYKPQ